jgi:hypothetical protein
MDDDQAPNDEQLNRIENQLERLVAALERMIEQNEQLTKRLFGER